MTTMVKKKHIFTRWDREKVAGLIEDFRDAVVHRVYAEINGTGTHSPSAHSRRAAAEKNEMEKLEEIHNALGLLDDEDPRS